MDRYCGGRAHCDTSIRQCRKRCGAAVQRSGRKSDCDPGSYRDALQPTGLDTAKLLMHAAQHGGIAGFEGVQTLNSEEFWRLETDLLIPAALEEQITEKNA